ncbi:MAG: hypothetical protein ACOYON_01945 [Fimbriimonas sp.]
MSESTHEPIRHEILKGIGGGVILLIFASVLGGSARLLGNENTALVADLVSIAAILMFAHRVSRRVAEARIVVARELFGAGDLEGTIEVLKPFGHAFNRKFDRDGEARTILLKALKLRDFTQRLHGEHTRSE